MVKKLYVFAGGGLKYNYSETKYPEQLNQDTEANNYSIAADGGVAWFFSKRFAIESSLLTASANYGVSKRSGVNTDNSTYKSTYTSFNLSSGGIFNNLGFKIYLLF
ncbi:MAG: hypothetical protein EOO93_18015 [Pedobacter sp.]|nr:MAG: hypothetical protein EOO93_18015 [Pedobacter sp.]